MNKNIAVIFGGVSAEHDVSIITAHTPIIDSLKILDSFNIIPLYISKKGKWYSDPKMLGLEYFKQDNFEESLSNLKEVNLSINDGLQVIWPGLMSKKVNIDLVFPAMHGTYGEDGSLMGLLRLSNVPFVGCDMTASAICMDKVLTKQLLEVENIPTTPYIYFTKNDWGKNEATILKEIDNLQWPVFVKPVHLGSSIAISKVDKKENLKNAIEVALHYDDKVLVEEGVENLIEVTLPIIGNDELELGEVEKALNKTEFFDFDEKYMKKGKNSEGVNNAYSELPAQIDSQLLKEVKKLGKRTYKILGCTGISRIDFLIDKDKNKVYVNEVNTLPGSLYHHNFKSKGVSSVDLVKKLLNLAEERFKEKENITYTFKSNILKNAGGAKNF